MQRTMLKSKIHRATVTDCDLHYVGSITIDPDLLEAADILEFEQVAVVDIDNGARFETYTIPGQRGSREMKINGAAARLVHRGDRIIVISYAGHGGQEPQPPGWHEPNGKSDNFLLANYRGSGAGSIERIVDWEMYQWLKAADDKGVQVIFVADSCHSGSMYRSVPR